MKSFRVSDLVRLTRTRKLIIMSDVHVGADDHDYTRWDEALDYAWENECVLILGGDVQENDVPHGKSVGSKLLSQVLSPTEQWAFVSAKLERFAKKGRIAGLLRGNHENRTRELTLIDPSYQLAIHLGVPYWGVGGITRFQAGKEVYQVAVHHGRSSSRNVWLELEKMAALYGEADVVAAGHVHHLNALRRLEAYLTVGPDGREQVVERAVWLVRTGCFQGFGEYPRELCAQPGRIGCPVLTFGAKTREIDVDVETLSWLQK